MSPETTASQEMKHGSTPPIGNSTPITVALAVILIGLAFSMGVGYQRLGATEEQGDRLEVIIQQQYELIRDNKVRIDLLEAEREYERNHNG